MNWRVRRTSTTTTNLKATLHCPSAKLSGSSDISCRRKTRVVSACPATLVAWDAVGEAHFSPAAPRILRQDVPNWEEIKKEIISKGIKGM